MGIEHEDGLTDEERELLAEHEEEINGSDDVDVDASAGADDDGEDAPPAAAPAIEPAAAEPAQPAMPVIELKADAGEAKAAIDALSSEKADLRKRYADGDLDREEYDAQIDALNERLQDARLQVKQSEMYEDISRQMLVKQWQSAVDRFMARPDNAPFKDGPLNVALDAEIRKMNAAEISKYPDHTERLAEAKRRVVAAAEAMLGRKADAPRKPRVEIPPSVDDIPPAGDEVDSEFTHLDRLEGAKFDAAFSRLTQDQRNRYLSES
ncbi:MAG: hypothetical protein B7Z13_04075 [Caulobacterales bacterium 32-67-6]|nr:MAG: hypothetical protein B7Z13_04075 [Caulobacterales bacterium 32-67-6]